MNDFARVREINKIRVKTPIIVPSFSSAGSNEIGKVHKGIGDRLGFASSVSAYDVYHKTIPEEEIWKTEFVLLDCGNFENEELNAGDARRWTPHMHEEVLDSLHPNSRLAVVNFDTFGRIDTQISAAETLFKKYPWASDFLCKPNTKNGKRESHSIINPMTIAANRKRLAQFDIIGFTEKELGRSAEERCRNLISIRKDLGPNQPIHIFGCIDPLGMIAYIICGADIFDGLGWMKYGIDNNLFVYRNNYSVITRNWQLPEAQTYRLMLLMNLRALKILSVKMRRFATSHSINEFELDQKMATPLMELLSKLGIEVQH